MLMSDFRKGLMLTAIPIVVLAAIGWAGILVEPLYVGLLLAIIYCLVTLILSLVLYVGTGQESLARGMFIGTFIGIAAVAALIWWELHRIGWT